jgi:2-(1,2-epoxy-1,2-dihydrophenyl)acetyl-CoA isomerase
MYDNIEITEDAGIVTITLNRPDKLNAMVGHMRRDLAEALEEPDSDSRCPRERHHRRRPSVLCGGDLERAAELIEEGNGEEFSRLLGAARRVITAIRQMTKPVIASVNGPASGAAAIWCLPGDLRIAAASATFAQLCKDRLSTGLGRTYFIPRLVPKQTKRANFSFSAMRSMRLRLCASACSTGRC